LSIHSTRECGWKEENLIHKRWKTQKLVHSLQRIKEVGEGKFLKCLPIPIEKEVEKIYK
jgi:hypothetical protein